MATFFHDFEIKLFKNLRQNFASSYSFITDFNLFLARTIVCIEYVNSFVHVCTETVRGKYIMPTPTAQERGGFCSSMSPGPASRDAEDVFPVGTHTFTMYTHTHIHTYIHTWPASHTDHRLSEHSREHRWCQQFHPLPVSG